MTFGLMQVGGGVDDIGSGTGLDSCVPLEDCWVDVAEDCDMVELSSRLIRD